MKIYTKTGDTGETGLFGGARLSKADARVESYGEVDELNSTLGVARAAGLSPSADAVLGRVQLELFDLGAELATTPGKEHNLTTPRIGDTQIEALEAAIDAHDTELDPLTNFVLPGGSMAAAQLHVARGVCRRAERRVVSLAATENVRYELVRYLNRLSDLLFTLARHENHVAGVKDVLWRGREGR
jgi:cob(I)alamin adenosyltransferase